MNTTEINKKFSEFLGGYEVDEYEEFDKDWNALMLVVERIEKSNVGTIIIDSKNIVTASFSGNSYRFYDTDLMGNVYNACNLFIDWYNKRKKEEKE